MVAIIFRILLVSFVILFLLRIVMKVRLTVRSVPPPKKEKSKLDPWKILGLQPGASKDMIVKAYRRKMMKNHPDKVADLDPEFQAFANRRAILIKEAYEDLIKAA